MSAQSNKIILNNIQQTNKMLSASGRCSEYNRSVLWQRNDPQCIQDEVMSYRVNKLSMVSLQQKLAENSVQQQQSTGKMDENCAVNGEVSLLDLGLKTLERFNKKNPSSPPSLSAEKEKTIENKEIEKEFEKLREDAKWKKMEKSKEVEHLREELTCQHHHIKSLNDKLIGVYKQSLQHFDHMSVEMKDLLEVHNMKVIQCRAFKNETKSLRSQVDLLTHRCGRMEWLVKEEQNDHEATKGKHRQQLSLNRKQSFQIQDLKKEVIGKGESLTNMEIELKKEKMKRCEQKKLDAGVVEDLKKELGECKMKLVKEKENVFVVKSLKHDVKECKKLLEKERMIRLKEEKLNAGIVKDLKKELDECKMKLGKEEAERCKREELDARVVNDLKKELYDCKKELNDKCTKMKELEKHNENMMNEKMEQDATSNEELEESKLKNKELQSMVDVLKKNDEVLKGKIELESAAKLKLSHQTDKLTNALSSRGLEARRLAKELDAAYAKNQHLQTSLDDTALVVKNVKRSFGKEKEQQRSFRHKMLSLEREKDAELLKVKTKLNATKNFLAKVTQESDQAKQKLKKLGDVRREVEVVSCGNEADTRVQSKEKKKRKSRPNGQKAKKGNSEKLDNKKLKIVVDAQVMKQGKLYHGIFK